MAIKIILVDDHPVILQGLDALLSAAPEFEVVGKFADGLSAISAIRANPPDIAIVDLNMPGLSGLGIISAVANEAIATKIILLTALATDAEMFDIVQSGASAVLMKDSEMGILMDCLRSVASGDVWLPNETVSPAIDREAQRRGNWRQLASGLTPRELELVRLTLAGAGNKQVSYELGITVGTTKVHMNNIFRKLGITSREQLVALAKDQS